MNSYKIPKDERAKCLEFLGLFKIKGRRVSEIATPGQVEIFHAIVFQPHKRVHVMCSTQIGKSDFISMACVVLSCIKGEVVCVVAPTGEKAKIIMRYYIQHLGDSPLFYELLDANTKLERLQQEENKERIILRNAGGIFVISANTSNSLKSIESSMGFGCKNVVSDESSLIPDDIEATIFRMIAGQGKDAFYCKVGNPFYRNHFLKSFRDDRYYKINLDYKRGLAEGRYTHEFIEEARLKPFFDILFENKFPAADSVDRGGNVPLVTEDELHLRVRPRVELFGEIRFGCDVAGAGNNYSVIVARGRNGARVLYKEDNADTMNFAGVIARFAKEYNPRKIYIDSVGIGKPVFDRLREFGELETRIIGVLAGEKAEDSVTYFNKKAEMYWRLKEWLPSAELELNRWDDLLDVRYRIQSDKRVRIKSKQEMRSDGLMSPDVSEALMTTFYDREIKEGREAQTMTRDFREMLKRRDSKIRSFARGIFYPKP